MAALAAAGTAVYAVGEAFGWWRKKRGGVSDARMQQLEQQIQQQNRLRDEMLRQLAEEQAARKADNTRFQNEMDAMKRLHSEELARHHEAMKKMEKNSLEEQLHRIDDHIRDLEAELRHCSDMYDELKKQMDEKAVEVHNERLKIAHFETERADASIKRLVILGKTGSGKSTLGNRLCGDESELGDEGPFVTSEGIESETFMVVKHICALGDERISIVDTPGIADSRSRDREHVNNMVGYLRGCDGVNQFLIVKSIANPRMDIHYQQMLRQFEYFFGQEFWRHATIVLTRVEGADRRRFDRVKSGLVKKIQENHVYARTVDIPVVGIGAMDYKEVLTDFVTNIVPRNRYMCDYLQSPLEDLVSELTGLQSSTQGAQEEVDRVRSRLASLVEKRAATSTKLSGTS